ncbi:TRP_N domain-containing protein [Candida albicans]
MIISKSSILVIWFTFLVSIVNGSRYIKSSSLLTCMENSQFTASFFDVIFYPGNNTVDFDVLAISTINNRTVGVNVNVIAYGLNVLQRNISLCDISYTGSTGAQNDPLCPINNGHLDVHSSYTLGSSVTKDIPGIAYTIPDLDARVRAVIYDTQTYEQLACVEATLSNGKTVQTKYAGWPIAAVSGLGVITSGVISIIGYSNTAAHIASNSMSLFVYFQSLAVTAMMAVARTPPLAAAWAQNFMWSLGVVRVGFVQDIANWYLQATGGTPTDILKSRYLSISVQKFVKKFIKRSAMAIAEHSPEFVTHLTKRINVSLDTESIGALDSDLYTTNEKSGESSGKILVLRGIQRVAYLSNIEITDMFMTSIQFLLFFVFVVLVCLMAFKAIIEILVRSKIIKEGKFKEYRRQWASIIKGTNYRILMLALPQIGLFCIWEFTVRDSAGIVVVAVFMLAVTVVLLLQAAVRVCLLGTKSVREYKNPAYLLFGDRKFLNRFGFLYFQYRADKYWYIFVSTTYIFLKSLIVAVLQNHGKPQSVIVWAIELIHLVVLIWIRPFMDKRTNVFNIIISIMNFINALFFMFFSDVFGQPSVVSSMMAVVYFILNAVFALFLLLFTVITCVLALLRDNPDSQYQPMRDDRVSFLNRQASRSDVIGKNNPRNGKDSELADLGKTAMMGHENTAREGDTAYQDSNSYDEDSLYFRRRAENEQEGYSNTYGPRN